MRAERRSGRTGAGAEVGAEADALKPRCAGILCPERGGNISPSISALSLYRFLYQPSYLSSYLPHIFFPCTDPISRLFCFFPYAYSAHSRKRLIYTIYLSIIVLIEFW